MARQSKKQQEKEMAVSSAQRDVGFQVLSADELGMQQREIVPAAFATWVRALLLNWRQGTVACKGRSDVSFSRKKPWKQKGTGRARVGSARSPLWRKGGIIFGPQKRVRALAVPRRVKQVVKNNVLSMFLDSQRIYCVDWAPLEAVPKTAQAVKVLRDLQIEGKKVALFVPFSDLLTRASWSNIPKVSMVSFDEAHAINLTNNDYLIVLKKDLGEFKEMVSKWH